MYLEHYGFDSRPFSLSPDPRFLFFSRQHSLAYHMLEYGLLSQAGITVISGEVGSGKTTLLRYLLNQHDEENLVVGLLADTEENIGKNLLSWVLMSFNLDHSGDEVTQKRRFQEFLLGNYAQGKNTVFIVDEAQNLSKKALERFRLLNNINSGEDELLKIILIGQPELLDKLQNPKLMQLAQRVTTEFHLGSLKAEDVSGYIKHRLEVAGGSGDIFDKAACYAIYYFTGGVPRLVNTLCDYALLYGFSRDLKLLSADAVIAATSGRRIGAINRNIEHNEDLQIAWEYVRRCAGIELSRNLDG